jgi:quercetin dioxygenase-like cupin family protein
MLETLPRIYLSKRSFTNHVPGDPSVGPPNTALPSPMSVEALSDIAAGLARIERTVPELPDADPDAPRSIRLINTESYDVWLITWPPGSELSYHDHADSLSVIEIVSGSLIESLGAGHWILRPGAREITPPHTLHRLWNGSDVAATSLHVYSPPLDAVTYFAPDPALSATPGNARVEEIRTRRAEASSRSTLLDWS